MLRYRFNEERATQAAAYLLSKAGGRESYMKLIKLIYLADRSSIGRWESPITGDSFVSMDQGPVTSGIYNLISQEPRTDSPCYWREHITRDGYDVKLVQDPGDDELSDSDVEILERVFEKFAGMDKWALVDYLHQNLPEWQDPHGSSIPIEPEEILRHSGRSDADVQRIVQEEQLQQATREAL